MSQPIEVTPRHKVNIANLHIEHERLMDCIHCGLCLSQCPTYAENGVEADSPRGRIYLMRALFEQRIEPTPDVVAHLDSCLGCRGCETACPSGVQYGYLLEGTRAHLRESGVKKSRKDAFILKAAEMTFPFPNRLEPLLFPIRLLRNTGVLPLLRKLGVMKLFGQLGDLEMLLPPLPAPGRRHQFAAKWAAQGERTANVGMLTGCVMPVMLPHVNEATARVLTRAGCEVSAPKNQVCCGAMHAHTGAMETAKSLARTNIEAFEKWQKTNGEWDAFIVNAAGCGSALKEYPHWFKGDAKWEARAQTLADKVRDVSEWLATPPYMERLAQRMNNDADARLDAPANGNSMDIARETLPNVGGAATLHNGDSAGAPAEQLLAEPANANLTDDVTLPRAQSSSDKLTVTYHDACHLAHGQGIRAAPRDLLAMLPDAQIIPLVESEMCCGSAGTYNITQPAMANDLLKRKMEKIAQTGATICVTGNPGCAMQLMLGAQKFGPRVQIKHPIELLDDATAD